MMQLVLLVLVPLLLVLAVFYTNSLHPMIDRWNDQYDSQRYRWFSVCYGYMTVTLPFPQQHHTRRRTDTAVWRRMIHHHHHRPRFVTTTTSTTTISSSTMSPLQYQLNDGGVDFINDDDDDDEICSDNVKQKNPFPKRSTTTTTTTRASIGPSPSSSKYSNHKRNNSPSTRNYFKVNDTVGDHYSNMKSPQSQQRPPRMTKSPEMVEDELSRALEALKSTVQQQKTYVATTTLSQMTTHHHTQENDVDDNNDPMTREDHDTRAIQFVLFPTIRECNAALAAFGDTNELLRALQVFGKMRKAVTLYQTLQQYLHHDIDDDHHHQYHPNEPPLTMTSQHWLPPIPAPTVVTYSTLMSRFVKADKPIVALRLWDLMIHSGSRRHSGTSNVPAVVIDVKAANILMNCYAKRADVRSAQQLLESMKRTTRHGHNATGTSIPSALMGHSNTAKPTIHMPAPNSITYNTFLSACHKSGDLDAAMAAVHDMRQLRLPLDALTYTTLIATVARKRSTIAGLYDPTPAFQFLQDMQASGISPNGMTYSALIDACGRCRRSDLALQGLRIMLRQKLEDSIQLARMKGTADVNPSKNYTLSGEVGAWTAAINACGKAGRLETAIRLFYTMPNFGLKPNTITCGSITDSLLRAGRTADTLDILRYMKNEGIQPSEVMYTSLMSRAEKLVELERQLDRRDRPLHPPEREMHNYRNEGKSTLESTKAIEVYTALMDSLINTKGKSAPIQNSRTEQPPRIPNSKTLLLLKVFLVFQEMKTAGVNIDVPCYNTLLRACAQVGDVNRAQYVIRTMQREELDPNDTSWRLLLRSAMLCAEGNMDRDNVDAIRNRVEAVEYIWKQALSYRKGRSSKRIDETTVTNQWNPSVDTFVTLISVYLREADMLSISPRNLPTQEAQRQMLRQQYLERVVELYDNILLSRNNDGMGMNRMNINQLLNSQRAMMAILQAIVYLEDVIRHDSDSIRQRQLRSMATSILQLECFSDPTNDDNHTAMKMSPSARQVLRKTRLWSEEAKLYKKIK